LVVDETCAPLRDKIEGIAPKEAGLVWADVDVDDPTKPSELLEVELTGPW
jgi:hypothetical protein